MKGWGIPPHLSPLPCGERDGERGSARIGILQNMNLWHYSVALDVGSYSLKLVQAGYRKGRFYLKRFATAPVPQGLITASLTKPNIGEEGTFKGILRDLFKKSGIKARELALLLPDLSLKVRFLEFQELSGSREEVKELARWRLKDSLAFSPEEVVLDYQEISSGGENGQGLNRILCLLGKREIIAQYDRLLEALGLQPRVVDSSSLGLYNFWEENLPASPDGVALLNLGHQGSTLLVAVGGIPTFIRSFELGGAALDEALATSLTIPLAEASRYKKEDSFLPPFEGEKTERPSVARPFLEKLAREVADSLFFYAEQEGASGVKRMVLAGGTSNLRHLEAFLGRELGLPVERLDPLMMVSFSSSLKLGREALLPLLPALGVAAREDT
ncbi:MAG: pilus assembly protein PilM [candidate division NC10 bacterium]|nr:pilus assembly protein PilM [candidate division NC10 bacterium]